MKPLLLAFGVVLLSLSPASGAVAREWKSAAGSKSIEAEYVSAKEGKVTIKDLAAGAEAAKAIKDNAEYKAARPGQWVAARADLVAELSKIPSIARMRGSA